VGLARVCFYTKIVLTIAEIRATVKTLAALVVAPLVPRPLVPEGWGVLVLLDKLETTDSAELMTEEREEREEVTSDGSGKAEDDNGGGIDVKSLNVEDGIGVNPLKVEVAG